MSTVWNEYDALWRQVEELWQELDATENETHRAQIRAQIKATREKAQNASPLPADTIPNKAWNGKRV
jgi:hypothetical protein